ncbi:hypothetical protein ANCDUO_00429 [Ancylostoma duodenale]|uniref:Glycogen [starch] synthase n=1 Tax=Ancylostoma duodenale TaxID=51022 RepID=A0A0C2E1H7_9BILA|nr:hypothetical protein ANCDUO_00429 [Ancylostoma duodenale]
MRELPDESFPEPLFARGSIGSYNDQKAEKNVGVTFGNDTSDYEEILEETGTPVNGIFIMYLMHSLPYAQSAFNWLFYAFLNRNLRNSSGRCGNGVRSVPMTSTIIENGASSASGLTPIWKNLQQMGSQLKTASIDTGNALLKMSPFRTRSRIQSRSLDSSVSPCYVIFSYALQEFNISGFGIPGSSRSTSTDDELIVVRSRKANVSFDSTPGTVAGRESAIVFRLATFSSDREAESADAVSGVRELICRVVMMTISTDPRCKDVTVIAFIIYPAAANSFNVDSLRGQAVCKQLKDTIAKIKENVANRMFEESVR